MNEWMDEMNGMDGPTDKRTNERMNTSSKIL